MDRPLTCATTRLLAAGVLAVSLSACSGRSVTETPAEGACRTPPEIVLDEPSAVVISIRPNPVSAGSMAVLSVSSEGLSEDALHGMAAAWQCWNGDEWISTHTLIRGVGPCPDPTGAPVCGEPGVQGPQVGVLAIGLGAPSAYPILIPDVPPGIYRIFDGVLLPNPHGPPEDRTGFVLVWVK